MISPQSIQQITSRIDIIDVVEEFVKLKKRGSNYLGLCPFHNEKTPSFTVSPAKEIYKCFGCGKSGNTITFLMEHEKLSYVEALKWLAQRYQVEIEETFQSDDVKQQQLVSDSLYILNSFAQKFFSSALLDTESGRDIAMSYLKERGFEEKVIDKFQLGFDPEEGAAFTQAALKNQFSENILVRSGLSVERNNQLLDNYRGRILFPIHNNFGKIMGFGARIIGNTQKGPKYINSPENEVYSKSKILYGMYFARQPIDRADECLLVEGYTDVISLHQAGIENVVASGGTSLTIDQLRLIKKYTNNLTIIYDGDSAGIHAALRGLDLALEERLNVQLVLIPDKEDPDSYVKKLGMNDFNKFIEENKKDFIFFQLDILLKDSGENVQAKSDAVNKMAETISRINKVEDFTKQQEYIRKIAQILKIDEAGFTQLVNTYIREKFAKADKKKAADGQLFNKILSEKNEEKSDTGLQLLLEDEYQEREVVKRLIEYGNEILPDEQYVADIILNVLDEFHLQNEKLEKIVESYQRLQSDKKIDSLTFLYSNDPDMNAFVAGLLHFPYELHDWGRRMEGYHIKLDKDLSVVIHSALNLYKLRKIKRMYMELEQELELETQEEKYIAIIRIYEDLKKIERDIAAEMQTVLLK